MNCVYGQTAGLQSFFQKNRHHLCLESYLEKNSGIDAELKTLYQMGGIAHILAISGLHISLLGGLLFD